MTAKEVAEWMLEKLIKEKYLYQVDVVDEIEAKFGQDFICENVSGNTVIDKNVLKEFEKLTKDIVVWERGERLWRMREKSDPIGRRQAD